MRIFKLTYKQIFYKDWLKRYKVFKNSKKWMSRKVISIQEDFIHENI